jgi:hypothetical protein
MANEKKRGNHMKKRENERLIGDKLKSQKKFSKRY